MYKVDFTATVRKSVTLTIFALFLLMCIFSLMIGSSFHIAEPPQSLLGIDNSGGTAQQRTEFLQRLGYSPDAESEETENITIPTEFSDVYSNYNELQKQIGSDLTLYKGAPCQRFTYNDTGSEYKLNIIVYKGRIIAGDRCTAALDGDMQTLRGSFE